MSDYTSTFGGAAKDTSQGTILGADWDTEYASIETAVATKIDLAGSPTLGNMAELSGVAPSEVADAGIGSTNLDGLTGNVETRLSLLEPRFAPSGWVRCGPYIFPDGSSSAATTASYGPPSGAKDAWFTVGESDHSEMDGQWTALDKLTGYEVQAILIGIRLGFTGSASGVHTETFWMGPRGVTPATPVTANAQAYVAIDWGAVSGFDDYYVEQVAWVPVTTDAEGVSFQLRYNRSLSNSAGIQLSLLGAMDTLQ